MDIILASKSPRRRGLFSLITDTFTFIDPQADESGYEGYSPEVQVVKIAERKCLAVAEHYPQAAVVGCDTLVEYNKEVFGKPRDRQQAEYMLTALSGATHNVYTGVAIKTPDHFLTFFCSTGVTFFPLSRDDIDGYIDSGEPFDKAGSYGLNERAARFVESLDGDYFNVLGLPVSRIYRNLKTLGVV